MDMAKEQKNPHHFIVGAQGALPVDAAGNPWSGSYVHGHGNLVLDLMDNLVLEALDVCKNAVSTKCLTITTLRATVAFLIVRDEAHQAAFAKALETLEWIGVRCYRYQNSILRNILKLNNYLTQASTGSNIIFGWTVLNGKNLSSGSAPMDDDTELVTLKEPRESFPIPTAPERPEEFAPGLDPDLQELADALTSSRKV